MLGGTLEAGRLLRKVLGYPEMLELSKRLELRLEEWPFQRRARDNKGNGQISLYVTAADS